jgi:hypothetical protein
MKKTIKKLTINKATLRTLTTDLGNVRGGEPIQSIEVCATGDCPSNGCSQGCFTHRIGVSCHPGGC